MHVWTFLKQAISELPYWRLFQNESQCENEYASKTHFHMRFCTGTRFETEAKVSVPFFCRLSAPMVLLQTEVRISRQHGTRGKSASSSFISEVHTSVVDLTDSRQP